jgi:hypothetical protein
MEISFLKAASQIHLMPPTRPLGFDHWLRQAGMAVLIMKIPVGGCPLFEFQVLTAVPCNDVGICGFKKRDPHVPTIRDRFFQRAKMLRFYVYFTAETQRTQRSDIIIWS